MRVPQSPLPHLDDVHRLIDAALATGERHLLEEARDLLADVLGTVQEPHPVSLCGVPHLYWPPRGFLWTETASSYAGWGDRFVVSLIVSYSISDAHDPVRACEAALALTRGDGSDGTRWFVHDRATKTTVVVDQGQFDPPRRPSRPAVVA